MTWPTVGFVDSLGSMDIRVDLSDNLGDETKGDAFGERDYDGEPGSVGAEYGVQTITLQIVCGETKDAAAQFFQPIARELGRDETTLLWHDSPGSEPRWYRLYRSTLPGISYENVRQYGASPDDEGNDVWATTLTLTADPYAYGPLESHTVTVSANPSGAASSVIPTNLAPNPSAEVSAAGWSASSGSVARMTGLFLGGSGSWTFGASGVQSAGEVVAQSSGSRCAVTAGQPFSVSLRAAIFGGGQSYSLRLRLRWFTAVSGGSQVGSTVYGAASAAAPPPVYTTTQTLAVAGLTVPATATAAEVGIEVVSNSAATGALVWDAVMSTLTASVQPYRDGDFAGWGWSGSRGASASGPMLTSPASGQSHVLLPPIKGDAPAPCRVEVLPTASLYTADLLMQLAAFDPPGADVGPVLVDLDDSIDATGFGAQVSAGGYVGTGYRRTTAATATLTGIPVLARPGAYRALVRVEKDANSSEGMAWRATLSSASSVLARRVIDTTGTFPNQELFWLDLGIVSLPLRAGSVDPEGAAAVTTCSLTFERTAGTLALRVDALMLVPHDAPRIGGRVSTMVLGARAQEGDAAFGGGAVTAIADPVTESRWLRGSAGIVSGVPTMRGGFLRVHPGGDNILTLVQQTCSVAASPYGPTPDDLAATCQVTLAYHPRFVWLSTGV